MVTTCLASEDRFVCDWLNSVSEFTQLRYKVLSRTGIKHRSFRSAEQKIPPLSQSCICCSAGDDELVNIGSKMKPRHAIPNASFCSYMAALHSTLQTSNDISRDGRSRSQIDPEQGCTYNMNDCYEKLKKMVPYMPANRRLTKVEILQYVIDYIQDLQLALEIQPAARSTRRNSGRTTPNRVPLSVLPSNRKDSQV